MDLSPYEKRIAAKTKTIVDLRAKAEEVARNFRAATVDFMIEWSHREVERAVTTQVEVTRKQGVGVLSELKQELGLLCENATKIVATHLDQGRVWPHRQEVLPKREEDFISSQLRAQGTEGISDGVRQVLGYSAALLVKYGFLNVGKDSSWEAQPGSGRPRYRYGITWSDQMKASLTSYADVYDELSTAIRDREALQNEKDQAEARGLWDQA